MLIQNLRKNIDDKWDECWPISSLRPIAILDLISYLFFIKKLDDRELINKKLQGMQGANFLYSKDVEEFTWSRLKNMDIRQIHDLFTKEHGIIDLMKQYAHSNSLYSDFFKAPLLLTPTPKLLFKVIEIINIIESSDKITQTAIANYLFDKATVGGQNGQVFLPENIAALMVAIGNPDSKDVTCDPSAGNGSLVINVASYIAARNNSQANRFENAIPSGMLKSMESDLIQLRLAAFNMSLHGIDNPGMEILNILPEGSTRLPEKPTLIISNLLFTEADGNMRVEGDTLKYDKSGNEIVLLKLILENLEPGARAVVILPEYLLNNIAPEIKKIRQDIINNYHLEGVIYLPSKSNSLIPGAGILVFNKHESITTDKVWFCKMKINREGNQKEESLLSGSQNDSFSSSELSEVADILSQWKSRNEMETTDPGNSFFVTGYDIKGNEYSLNFNDYKIIRQARESTKKIENADNNKTPVVATKKEYLHHFFEESNPVKRRKPRRKILTVIVLVLILASAGAGIYFFYGGNISFLRGQSKPADSLTGGKEVVKPLVKSNNLDAQPGLTITASKKYTVSTKAYFHSAPDSSKRKSTYLQPRKNVVLNSSKEQNGFVYVVYVNKSGQATKGWLSRKSLEPVE